MPVEVTNANDVSLTVSRPDQESFAQAPAGRLIVDDFSLTRTTDLSSHSGAGRNTPIGISIGDVEYTFEFTVEGEHAELFDNITTNDNDEQDNDLPVELQLRFAGDEYEWVLNGAFVEEDSFSGTSGDATEFDVSGMATDRDKNRLNVA